MAHGKTPFIESVIRAVSPGWAASRAASRLRAQRREAVREVLAGFYTAGERGRLTKDWPFAQSSADAAILGDIGVFHPRARAVARNNWAGRSAIGAYQRHGVGKGITAKSAGRLPKGYQLPAGLEVSDEDFARSNLSMDWWFDLWCRSPRWCDMERRKPFWMIQRQGMGEFAISGQSLIVLGYEPRPDMVGLVLQTVEVEQLDTSLYKNPDNDNEIRGGVEINEYGAPTAYWLYLKGHPYDSTSIGDSTRIPADRVLDLIETDRPRQTRGVGRLIPILKKMWHLDRYDEYELVAARIRACIGVIMEMSDMPDDDSDLTGVAKASGEDETDDRGNLKMTLAPGMVMTAPFGFKPHTFQPAAPQGQYDSFTNQQLNHIGAGSGLDYATLVRDYTRGSYSSQRQGKNELHDELDPVQQMMIDQWCRPIREEFFLLAMLERRFPAPGYFENAVLRHAYMEAEWRGPAKREIDPAKAAAARKINIDYRFETRRSIGNEDGYDWRENFDQHAEEQGYADEKGIYLPDAQAAKPAVAPQEPRPDQADDAEDDPDGQADAATRSVMAAEFGREMSDAIMRE